MNVCFRGSVCVCARALLDTFQTKCLRKITRIFWSSTIRKDNLLRETEMIPTSVDIEQIRWKWIRHVLRMLEHSLSRTALGHLREIEIQVDQKKHGEEQQRRCWRVEDLQRKKQNKRQRTDRCGDFLIQAATCVFGTDRCRERDRCMCKRKVCVREEYLCVIHRFD
jgi:hypothetical protein